MRRHLQCSFPVVVADNAVAQCLDVGQCKCMMRRLTVEGGGCDETVYLVMENEIRRWTVWVIVPRAGQQKWVISCRGQEGHGLSVSNHADDLTGSEIETPGLSLKLRGRSTKLPTSL